MGDKIGSKQDRLLYIYTSLLNGEALQLSEIAEKYEVSEKSVSRDFELIELFLSDYNLEKGSNYEIVNIETSKREKGQFQLKNASNKYMSRAQVLSVCKILMDSRGLPQKEMSPIVEKLVASSVSAEDQRFIKELLLNEWFNYVEPSHKTPILDSLLEISKAIKAQRIIQITYVKTNGDQVERILEPLGIIFSEYYFYLAGNIKDFDKQKYFQIQGDENPTMYRVDRIKAVELLDQRYMIQESQRFKEGEYRKRIQFMYGGALNHIKLLVKDFALEAVCDKLATANVTKSDQAGYENIVEAELFGDGILMWLMGQGDGVKLIAPENLVKKLNDKIGRLQLTYQP
ncbi:MAG: WYL domain-containing protein [Clostridiaceae bacterium]